MNALSVLLDSLGDLSDQTALIILDDFQWADDFAVKLLDGWQRKHSVTLSSPKELRTLVALSFRSEEARAHPAMRSLLSLEPTAHLTLGRLPETETQALLESMAGSLPEDATRWINRLSQGNPFLAVALIQGMTERRVLYFNPDTGWELQRDSLTEAQFSDQSTALMLNWLSQLPESVLDTLSIGSILGKEFELDLTIHLTGQSPKETVANLEQARKRHILWANAQGTQYIFVHDRFRERLLERLDSTRRQELHYLAAKYIESMAPERDFDLAYHFDQAGKPESAFKFAVAAAQRARTQHALEVAELYYKIAERGLNAAPDETTALGVIESLADILTLRGIYVEAQSKYELALSMAKTSMDQARIEGKIADLAFKRSDLETSTKAVKRALGLLGKTLPRSQLFFVFSLFLEAIVHLFHSFFPSIFLAKRPLDHPSAQADLLAIRLYHRLSYVWWFQCNRVPMIWSNLRVLNLAEKYVPTPELASGYAMHTVMQFSMPRLSLKRGLSYGKRAVEICEQLGDLWGRGQALSYYGMALVPAGQFHLAEKVMQEAIPIFERTGDRWELSNIRMVLTHCLLYLGKTEEALRSSRKVYEGCLQTGETQFMGHAVSGWALASGGKVPQDILNQEIERPREGDITTVVGVYDAQGAQLLFGEKNPEHAAKVFKQAIEVIQKYRLRNEFIGASVYLFFRSDSAANRAASHSRPTKTSTTSEGTSLGIKQFTDLVASFP
jgi:tetratricopeptide (TPR) repeat protein